MPACGISTARAPLPPWAQGGDRSSCSIQPAKLPTAPREPPPLPPHSLCGADPLSRGHTPEPWHHRCRTRDAPGQRGRRRRTTQRCNILALKKKKPPRDALIFATTDSHYRLLGHGAGPGSAGSDGPGSGGETLKTRTDWKLSALVPAAYQRLEAGAQGRGTPLQSYPSSFNEPHGAELVPSPTQATSASAQRIVTVLACTVLMYQKTL